MFAGVRIGNREVKLTNLDKVFFPKLGLTKGDLIQYYLGMAPYVLHQASGARCRCRVLRKETALGAVSSRLGWVASEA